MVLPTFMTKLCSLIPLLVLQYHYFIGSFGCANWFSFKIVLPKFISIHIIQIMQTTKCLSSVMSYRHCLVLNCLTYFFTVLCMCERVHKSFSFFYGQFYQFTILLFNIYTICSISYFKFGYYLLVPWYEKYFFRLLFPVENFWLDQYFCLYLNNTWLSAVFG